MKYAGISARLKIMRGQMTQAAFAEANGVGLGAYSRFERGLQRPGAELLYSLLSRGLSIDWLLTGQGSKRSIAGADVDLKSRLKFDYKAKAWVAK